MKALDVLTAPWAIRPETLQVMLNVYDAHTRGESVDIEKLKAATGSAFANDPSDDYAVIDGVAVIDVVGVLGKRFDLFTQICGGASTQRLQAQLAEALTDPAVHSIVLNVDSPGGEVDGTQALATDVFNARAEKPVVALIDGVGASGAYWIASAAGKVYLAGDTTVAGSIGVVMAHTDVSKAQDMRGVKTTEITAGKYKRIASNYAPLTPEGRQSLQDVVDHIYAVFVDSVANNRGKSADVVEKDMADGRIFLGQQAIDAGLADGFSTLAELIAELNEGFETRSAMQYTGAGALNSNKGAIVKTGDKENTAAPTAEQIATQIATAEATAFERGKTAGKAEGKAEGLIEGATAERERILAIESHTLPGHEALVAALKADGKTSGPEAAVKILQAEQSKLANLAGQLKKDSPDPVHASGADKSADGEPSPQIIADKAKLHIAAQKKAGINVSASEAVAHVRKEMGLK
jgi:signal peptide peptidase SppA